jgi:hypothetical protein
VRADPDPADSSTAVDDKCRTSGEVDGVDTGRLVHAIRARHGSRFVKENRERVYVFLDVLLSAEEPVDFLRGNKYGTCIPFNEFLVSRLELSQLLRAVRSPGAANEHQYERPSTIVGEAHGFSISRWEGEIWSRVAGSKRFW